MRNLFAALVAISLSAGASQAATLSIDTLPSGYFGSTIATVPEATITSFGDDLFFSDAADDYAFCATSALSCTAHMQIDFTNVISNLSFDVEGWEPGDFVGVNVYGVGNTLIGSVDITSNSIGLDFSSFGSITRLFFNDSSTNFGVAYSNFSFTENSISTVPLPASLPFLMLGLGAFGLAKRRKSN